MDRPTLFDLPARMRAMRRAEAIGFADFLHQAVAAEIEDRLKEVNRTFTTPAIHGAQAARWSAWLGLDATLVPEADVLDLSEGSHDLILSALALHAANDPVGQLVQMRRALKPDGLLLATLFGGETLSQLRSALAAAESAETGGLAPRIAPMGELRDLGGLLQRAGLALPVADAVPFTVTYDTPLKLMADLRAMGETNCMTQRHRGGLRRGVLMRAVETYISDHAQADGRVPAQFDVVVLTGWAPAASQPKPLRPGSATTRLADALGTQETPAGEPAAPGRRD
ncbi:MAG: methyltransferase domain-containing protein [Pseudomonadota bacterium]